MANQEQLDILLKQGTEAWNTWRIQNHTIFIDFSGANLIGADLNGANLSWTDLSWTDLSTANLIRVNLVEAKLIRADLIGANFSGANLGGANFSGANLSWAILSGANFSGANFSGANFNEAYLNDANFNGTNFSGANFSGANLSGANFSGADLSGADLSGAIMGWTVFGSLDLCTVKGLEKIRHDGPSIIGTDTLERSEGDIPDVFLREAGLSETFITYARLLVQSPTQYYTCFISYSSKDQKFAERLHADLRQKGIKCWFAPEDLKIGEKFPNRIEEAIRLYDKLLIILSQNSIDSSWVEDEARAALEKETHLKETHLNTMVLFPIKIDTSIEQCQSQWVAKLRRERHIGDFTRWKYRTRYEKAFQRLIRDLQPDQQ